jgi:hypothetical protein
MSCFVRLLRFVLALSFFIASAASVGAAAPLTDDMLVPLTTAYALAVAPGEQADIHRQLFATVLERVQRTYAREVDMPALVSTAVNAIESGSHTPAIPPKCSRKR